MSDVGASATHRACERLAAGEPVVIHGGHGADGAPAVAIAAEHATAERVNFMVKEARGLIALALTPQRCDELDLLMLGRRDAARDALVYTVSIEAREGVTTGISAHDRARTIAVAVDPASGRDDLVRPGHVFPIRTRGGGVLERAATPEAAIDLVDAAGCRPAAVICQVLADDGETADAGALERFAARHGLVRVAIDDVVELRLARGHGLGRRPA